MLPGIYGFAWDTGHIVFLGAFYAVLTVILITLTAATVRSVRAFRLGRVDAVRWHSEFHDLPAEARRCRHALTGGIPGRTCDNGFDCRSCATHGRILNDAAVQADSSAPAAGWSVKASIPHILQSACSVS